MATASVTAHPRRRPRSTRLIRAAVLLGLAATVAVAAVILAVVTDAGTPWPVAGGLVVLALGAAATRSTHLEVLVARRDGAGERARLAKEYRALTDERISESAEFTDVMGRRVADGERRAAEQLTTIRAHEAALEHRERRLAVVEAELETAKDRLAGTETLARTQSARADDLAVRLRNAEATAAEVAADSATQITHLEAECDALRSELRLWQSAGVRRREA